MLYIYAYKTIDMYTVVKTVYKNIDMYTVVKTFPLLVMRKAFRVCIPISNKICYIYMSMNIKLSFVHTS